MKVKALKQYSNLKNFAQVLLSASVGGLIGFSFGASKFTIFLCALSATAASVLIPRKSRTKKD